LSGKEFQEDGAEVRAEHNVVSKVHHIQWLNLAGTCRNVHGPHKFSKFFPELWYLPAWSLYRGRES